jgi:hypothetical protein
MVLHRSAPCSIQVSGDRPDAELKALATDIEDALGR